jgi:D-alanyl-D-alanine carboxypeptidase (penicillin-binding protein 5/6)
MQYRNLLLLALTVCAPQAHSVVSVPPLPQLDARAYLLMDYQSGRVIVHKNADQQMEPASLTKMMTIYAVASEIREGRVSLNDEVIVSEKAWRMTGSRMFIEVGKKVSIEDLMKGDIVQSGNDASVALAEHVSGSEEMFVVLMNQHAGELGLKDTHFVNSTGLPHSSHLTSARDIAALSAALIREFPAVFKIFSTKEFTYNGIKQQNRNKLLFKDESVDGIKTGYTDSAGFCLAASASREGRRLISVVMGASDGEARATSSLTLLNYGFRFFENHRLFAAGESVHTAKIWKGETDSLKLGLERDLYVTIPVGGYESVDAAVDVQSEILAPMSQGEKLGTLRVTLADKELSNRPLLSLNAVAEAGVFSRLVDEVKLWFQ